MTGAAQITTERLTLTPKTVGDAVDLYPIFSDPLPMRRWHSPPHGSISDTRAMIDTLLTDPACWWTIRRSADGHVQGKVGYLLRLDIVQRLNQGLTLP